MTADQTPGLDRLLEGLAQLQSDFGPEVKDIERESPAAALDSLENAVNEAPSEYRPYLDEAVECYRRALYRAAILMVWAAVVQHLYSVIQARRGGLRDIERANYARFGPSTRYRELKKINDLLYLGEKDFITLCEDAGMLNRNARKMLHERLDLRNLCGHPTRYRPGREETVVFIESLTLNILNGSWLDW